VSIDATRWFGSERGATVETEESAVPRSGGGQQDLIPLLGLARHCTFGYVCMCIHE
jgi:hypothetical protein